MKYILLFSLLIFFDVTFTKAQTATPNHEAAVAEVIKTLFRGMEKGDSAMARNTFTKKVTSATVFKDKSGNTILRQEESISDFMKAIATPHQGVWYEEIWNLKIQVDGDFAQAWCDYAFYVDNNFSHCGVDALHLVNEKGQWRIFHLADTRRKTGCEVPDDVKKKHQ
jgi:hypothetical protein